MVGFKLVSLLIREVKQDTESGQDQALPSCAQAQVVYLESLTTSLNRRLDRFEKN